MTTEPMPPAGRHEPVTEDRAVTAFLEQVRAAHRTPPDDALAQRHLELILSAVAARPAPAASWWERTRPAFGRLTRRAAAVGAVKLALTAGLATAATGAGLAATGNLPTTVQHDVAELLDGVGVQIPDPADLVEQAPSEDVPAPGGAGRPDDLPAPVERSHPEDVPADRNDPLQDVPADRNGRPDEAPPVGEPRRGEPAPSSGRADRDDAGGRATDERRPDDPGRSQGSPGRPDGPARSDGQGPPDDAGGGPPSGAAHDATGPRPDGPPDGAGGAGDQGPDRDSGHDADARGGERGPDDSEPGPSARGERGPDDSEPAPPARDNLTATHDSTGGVAPPGAAMDGGSGGPDVRPGREAPG